MNEQLIEKFASALAACATTGDNAALQKEAADNKLIKSAISPMLYAPLLSAGIGGLGGYYGTSGKEKHKRRNALYGAIGGGLTGFAGAALAPVISDLNFSAHAGKSPVSGAVDAAAANSPRVRSTDTPSTVAQILDTLGLAGGAAKGQAMAAKAYDKRTGVTGRQGELERLAQGRGGLGGAIDKARGKSNPYSDPLRRFFDAHGPGGEPFATSLNPLPPMPQKMRPRPTRPVDPSTLPGFLSGHVSSTQAMDNFNKAVSQYNKDMQSWHADGLRYNEQLKAVQQARAELPQKLQDAEALHTTKSIGESDGDRARRAKLTEEIIKNRGGNGKPTGTLHSDLKPHARAVRPGRVAARGAGLVGGGIAGGVITDLSQRIVGNLIDALRGNAQQAK
jgi:hypothetical protein